MKKQNILAKIAVIILTAVITLTSVCLVSNTAHAATTYNTDSSNPASGNIFVQVSGNYVTESASKLVKRINEIRYEACKQGVKNPETGKKLTLADYKPVVWSETLEAYARLRAAEASVNWAHTRPSNKSTFKNTVKLANGYHSAENLAMGYTLLKSLEGYYGEKSGYTRNGKACHYSVMISPSYTLVGMAGFQQSGKQIFSAMEFGTILKGKKNTNSTKQTGLKVSANQIIEVKVGYLVNSFTLSGSKKVAVGKKIKLTATANMKNATKTATVTKGLTWKSSNTKVATVDANGNVKGIKAGTVTITATAGNKTVSYKVTITK